MFYDVWITETCEAELEIVNNMNKKSLSGQYLIICGSRKVCSSSMEYSQGSTSHRTEALKESTGDQRACMREVWTI